MDILNSREVLGDVIYGYLRIGKFLIREPWNGGGIFPKDTGLCNRLFHWEICEFINKKNNGLFQMIIEDDFWPEKEFIDLPNANFLSKSNLHSHFENNEIKYSEYKKIDLNHLEKMIKTSDFQLNLNQNYQSSFGYNHIWDVYKTCYDLIDRPIKNITIKNTNIQWEIANMMQDVVGIHIRWGYGVNKPKEITEYIKKFPIDLPNLEMHSENKLYDYVDEKEYINLIREILKYNKNQKFYISCDLGEESLVHIKQQFKENILTYKDVIRRIIYNFVHKDLSQFNTDYQNIVNIIDLFSLAYCGIFYRYPNSSWSDFAQIYRDVPTESIDAENHDLITHYLKYSFWNQ